MPGKYGSSMDLLREGASKGNNHYRKVFVEMATLFQKADTSHDSDWQKMKPADFLAFQKSAKDNKLSKAEFTNKLDPAKLNQIVPNFLANFKDEDGDGDIDMDDVWLALDTDRSGDLSFDEFVTGLLKRSTPAKEVFQTWMNDSGVLLAEDVILAIQSMGYNPTDAEAMEIVNQYDQNADGEIDESEWLTIVQNLPKLNDGVDDPSLQQKIKEQFAVLAKGDSAVSTAELQYVFCNLGTKLDEGQAAEMIKVVDANSDGSVDAEEFMAMRGLPGMSFETGE